MIHIILISFLFVESVKSNSTLCACTVSNTNVYFDQTINSRIITRLLPGDCVTVVNKDTEWFKVSVNNLVGFVTASEVTKRECPIEQTETEGQYVKRFLESIDRNDVCLQEHCLNCICHSGGDQCGDCHFCHKSHGQSNEACSQWTSKVDGAWSDWNSWRSCSTTCGGGDQVRIRACDNPPKATIFGKDCEGNSQEQQRCNTQHCPIDGGWTAWGPYSTCSAKCGSQSQGFKFSQRNCTNPAPHYNGHDCVGDKFKYIPCQPDCTSAVVLQTQVQMSVTTTQQTPSFNTCDKLGVEHVLFGNLKVSHSLAPRCPDNTFASPEALPMEFCLVGRTSTWHKYIKVTDACTNHVLATQFVPVASYQGSVLTKFAGIFLGCTDDGFKVAMQLCGHPVNIYHIYNSSTINGILDPNNYYIVINK